MMNTRPGISVDDRDLWFYRGERMMDGPVLQYFKANLERNEEGEYVIRNQFGELMECATLDEVRGFPLKVVDGNPIYSDDRLTGFQLTLDSGETVEIAPEELFTWNDTLIFTCQRGIPVRFQTGALMKIAACMEESQSGYELLLDREGELRKQVQQYDGDLFFVPETHGSG